VQTGVVDGVERAATIKERDLLSPGFDHLTLAGLQIRDCGHTYETSHFESPTQIILVVGTQPIPLLTTTKFEI
jgi:hypothetical protein